MLAFGFSSGLPFALLIGTLNAWLGEVEDQPRDDRRPLLDRACLCVQVPVVAARRPACRCRCSTGSAAARAGSCSASAVLIAGFAGLAATDPATDIGTFAIFAVLAALRLGDPGHRGRRLADRRRRRADPGRTALVHLPVRLSHREHRRRRAGARPGGADVLVARLSADGRARARPAGRRALRAPDTQAARPRPCSTPASTKRAR